MTATTRPPRASSCWCWRATPCRPSSDARRRAAAKRLAGVWRAWQAVRPAAGRWPSSRTQRLSGIGFLNTILGRLSLVRPLVRMIRQAGLKKRVGEVLLYIPLLAFSTFLIVIVIGGRQRLGVLLGMVAGAMPLIVIQRMRAQAQHALRGAATRCARSPARGAPGGPRPPHRDAGRGRRVPRSDRAGVARGRRRRCASDFRCVMPSTT